MEESGLEVLPKRKKSTRRDGKPSRYKTITGLFKTVTALSQFKDNSSKEIRCRSFEKINCYSDEETIGKAGNKSDKLCVKEVKQREFRRRHSEFSLNDKIPRQPSVTIRELDENKKKANFSKAKAKLKELLETEIRYVQKDLKTIEVYYKYIEESRNCSDVLLGGNDRVIFANVRDIYNFHFSTFLPELKIAIEDPESLKILFEDLKDSFKLKYGRYCVNKPKSEQILVDNKAFFSELWVKLEVDRGLSDLMTTPVRRIQMYSLLLKDIFNLLGKAGQIEKYKKIKETFDIATEIAEYVDNMMMAGRILGFQGDITKHGLLLKRGEIDVFKKPSANVSSKVMKFQKCQIFLFEESVVICHIGEKPKDQLIDPILSYWCHYQMNRLEIGELSEEKCTFEIKNGNNNHESYNCTEEDDEEDTENVVILKCEHDKMMRDWLQIVNEQRNYLNNFADELSKPV